MARHRREDCPGGAGSCHQARTPPSFAGWCRPGIPLWGFPTAPDAEPNIFYQLPPSLINTPSICHHQPPFACHNSGSRNCKLTHYGYDTPMASGIEGYYFPMSKGHPTPSGRSSQPWNSMPETARKTCTEAAKACDVVQAVTDINMTSSPDML